MPVVLAVLGLVSADGLLDVPWEECRPSPTEAGNPVNGPYWLPHYEAVKRGWTSDTALRSSVNADEFLTRLIAAGVTFLDDSDFLRRAEPDPYPLTGPPADALVARGRVMSERSGVVEEYD